VTHRVDGRNYFAKYDATEGTAATAEYFDARFDTAGVTTLEHGAIGLHLRRA
jgi:hypothetical protein